MMVPLYITCLIFVVKRGEKVEREGLLKQKSYSIKSELCIQGCTQVKEMPCFHLKMNLGATTHWSILSVVRMVNAT